MKEKYYDLKKINKTSFVLLKPEDYEQLQQQLAEKDQEIERLVKDIEWLKKCNNVLANKCYVPKNKKGE